MLFCIVWKLLIPVCVGRYKLPSPVLNLFSNPVFQSHFLVSPNIVDSFIRPDMWTWNWANRGLHRNTVAQAHDNNGLVEENDYWKCKIFIIRKGTNKLGFLNCYILHHIYWLKLCHIENFELKWISVSQTQRK